MNPCGYISDAMRYLITRVYVHPVTLELVFLPIDTCSDDWISCFETVDETFSQFIQQHQWNALMFPWICKVVFTTNQTGNDDERGGGCGNLKLSITDFEWTITTDEGVLLKHLVEGCYRMKGSKYDWCYELYQSCLIQFNETEMLVEIQFEYGS